MGVKRLFSGVKRLHLLGVKRLGGQTTGYPMGFCSIVSFSVRDEFATLIKGIGLSICLISSSERMAGPYIILFYILF